MKRRRTTCPECGKPLAADAPEGVCPACSLRFALRPEELPDSGAGLVGTAVGHFELLEVIGRGGMGVVYRARDTHLARKVAIKLLAPERVTDLARVSRFVQEAKAASALNHPNVVTIHDVSEAGGQHYIVMEYVEGKTLDKLIGDKGLPIKEALGYATQIASALARAHEAGIVHRDLKPRNIMVGADGGLKLLDFGLAKLVETSAAATHVGTESGRIMGTLAYMSPEQAEGRSVDARSDLFSFGVVFHEMITGRNTFFRATTGSTLAAILRDEPAPLVGVPPAIGGIIERCLRKRPQDRLASAGELLRLLEAAKAAPAEVIPPPPPAIVVLPFANLSGDPTNDYFSDGLSEDIINALARIPGLRVIARTSAFACRGEAMDITEISARLNVGYVLEGSVRKTESQVRVTAQLIDSADQCHLWSERYDREITDIFSIQDDIARAISTQLRVQLKPGQTLVKSATSNPEAYNLYLQGRQLFNQLTPEGFQKAKALFEEATRLDPELALAHDALAELWWFLGFYGFVAPRDAFSMGVWAALRAIEVDEKMASPHAMLAMYRKELDYNWPEVHREFQRAFELDPHSPVVRFRHTLSGLLPAGRLEEASQELTELVQADPLSPIIRSWLGTMLYFQRLYEESLQQCRRVLEMDSRNHFAHAFCGFNLAELGRMAEAGQAFQLANECSGGLAWVRGFAGWGLGRAGKHGEARESLAQLLREQQTRYIPPTAVGFSYLGLGENESAMEWFDKALEARDPFIIPLKSWPIFDPIRPLPGYRELLRKMNMTA